METIFVINETTQLVLVPQNEFDRILLNKLTSNGPVEVVVASQPLGILNKSVQDAVIIKSRSDDTSKA